MIELVYSCDLCWKEARHPRDSQGPPGGWLLRPAPRDDGLEGLALLCDECAVGDAVPLLRPGDADG